MARRRRCRARASSRRPRRRGRPPASGGADGTPCEWATGRRRVSGSVGRRAVDDEVAVAGQVAEANPDLRERRRVEPVQVDIVGVGRHSRGTGRHSRRSVPRPDATTIVRSTMSTTRLGVAAPFGISTWRRPCSIRASGGACCGTRARRRVGGGARQLPHEHLSVGCVGDRRPGDRARRRCDHVQLGRGRAGRGGPEVAEPDRKRRRHRGGERSRPGP